MDFKFTVEDEAFRQELRRWLEANLPRDSRDDGELHDPDTKEEFEQRRAWHRKLYDAGWMCIHWPKEYGGLGLSLTRQLIPEYGTGAECEGTSHRQHSRPHGAGRLDAGAQRRPHLLHVTWASGRFQERELRADAGERTVLDDEAKSGSEAG